MLSYILKHKPRWNTDSFLTIVFTQNPVNDVTEQAQFKHELKQYWPYNYPTLKIEVKLLWQP